MRALASRLGSALTIDVTGMKKTCGSDSGGAPSPLNGKTAGPVARPLAVRMLIETKKITTKIANGKLFFLVHKSTNSFAFSKKIEMSYGYYDPSVTGFAGGYPQYPQAFPQPVPTFASPIVVEPKTYIVSSESVRILLLDVD